MMKLFGTIKNKLIKPLIPSRILTALTWDKTETANDPAYWWNFSVIRSIYQQDITGESELSWYTYQIRKRKTPFGRVLAFGDGYGMAAEAAITRKDTSEIVYFNISRGEGERFIKLMKDHSFSFPYQYIEGDANHYDFNTLGFFDTIISVGSFHHFELFESIFPKLNCILKSDGLLYADEFVGPSKWQYSRKTIQKINEWFNDLPSSLVFKKIKIRDDAFFELWKNGSDPSECIRSSELDEWMRKCFSILETKPFGGTWLMPFFLTSHLKPLRLNINNWHSTEIGQKMLQKMTFEEKSAIDSGEIKPHYIYYLCTKQT